METGFGQDERVRSRRQADRKGSAGGSFPEGICQCRREYTVVRADEDAVSGHESQREALSPDARINDSYMDGARWKVGEGAAQQKRAMLDALW